MAALVAPLSGVVPAQAEDDLQKRKQRVEAAIEQLAGDIDEVSREYALALARQRAVEAKLPPARAAVAQAKGQLAAAKARESALAQRLAVAVAQVAKAEAELDQVQVDIEAAERALGRLARSAYQEGAPNDLAIYLDATSIGQVLDGMAYAQSAAHSETAIIRRLADARADLAAQRATLEAKREAVAKLRADAVVNVGRTKALEAAAVAAEREVVRLVKEAREASAGIAAERAAELRRMAAAEAEAARLSKVLAERARAARAAAAARAARAGRGNGGSGGGDDSTRSLGSGILSRPANGSVSSPYGMRVHPVTGVYKLHDGTDFALPCGTPVRSAAAGVVVEAGYAGAWGNRIVVDHGLVGGAGLATSYNHLSSIGARGKVARGQVLGYSGTTGSSTGCHLHFSVYVNGSTVDPMRYL